jgi:metal-sulfur cluster biosynthetic enzyme
VSVQAEILAALATVVDPERDEPITDSGLVRSVGIDDAGVTVHLQLPIGLWFSNVAYLIACEARDALREVENIRQVRVLVHGHHDSNRINAWLVADTGDVDTVCSEAEGRLGALRQTFLRRAHAAAMERCVWPLIRQKGLNSEQIRKLTLRDLPDGKTKNMLLRRRFALGLSMCPNARVVFDDLGDAHLCSWLSATPDKDIEENIEETPEAAAPQLIHTRTRGLQ